MKRADLTEKILDIKRERGWTWRHICGAIGGFSDTMIVGALLGQMKLTKPQAGKAAELFGLTAAEEAMLNEIPHRGTPMPPTDPLIYRFYERVMVYGTTWKELIHLLDAAAPLRYTFLHAVTCESDRRPPTDPGARGGARGRLAPSAPAGDRFGRATAP